MKRIKYLAGFGLICLCLPMQALANNVTANSTLTRGTMISSADLSVETKDETERQALLSQYIGMSVVRTISSGSAIKPRDVAAPVQVKRNSSVKMIYRLGRLEISATGRALGEGRMGDIITVMNTDSRKRVEGRVTGMGIVEMVQ
jgi:flagella basal body P-ring formation protein FlgA